jgi:hypothetical protein
MTDQLIRISTLLAVATEGRPDQSPRGCGTAHAHRLRRLRALAHRGGRAAARAEGTRVQPTCPAFSWPLRVQRVTACCTAVPGPS